MPIPVGFLCCFSTRFEIIIRNAAIVVPWFLSRRCIEVGDVMSICLKSPTLVGVGDQSRRGARGTTPPARVGAPAACGLLRGLPSDNRLNP